MAEAASTEEYEVRAVRTPDEFEAALQVRFDVFCNEQGVPEREERDGRDHSALHLIAVQDGAVVGTCRLVFVGNTVQFSRLAVAIGARRQGIATALLDVADQEAVSHGANRLVLHAQVYAKPLYDQTGYVARGPHFFEAGIEHVAMEKLL